MTECVEIDERVYEKLVVHQRENETLSETLRRLVDQYEERRSTEG
jgi:predicted CopG family antitoxin